MGAEGILFAGYSLFLLAVALGLDRLALHSHRRSETYRTNGFRFRGDLDAWECPEGEFLRRIQIDDARRLVRYRAKAAVCNACPAKGECTDSDDGRELAHPMDAWPHSEAGRFHRGICVMLAALAAVIAAIGLARGGNTTELTALAVVLSLAGALTARLISSFWGTPSGFPAPTPRGAGEARPAPPRGSG